MPGMLSADTIKRTMDRGVTAFSLTRESTRLEQGPAMDPAELMQLAIEKAREGIARGQTPFGCAIARGGEILAVEHNVVFASTDVTAHAEITALRAACAHAGQVLLEGAQVATTCEPCPMCMGALLWARVDTIWFGASIGDAASAGFHEIQLPAAELAVRAPHVPNLRGGLLVSECAELFRQFCAANGQCY